MSAQTDRHVFCTSLQLCPVVPRPSLRVSDLVHACCPGQIDRLQLCPPGLQQATSAAGTARCAAEIGGGGGGRGAKSPFLAVELHRDMLQHTGASSSCLPKHVLARAAPPGKSPQRESLERAPSAMRTQDTKHTKERRKAFEASARRGRVHVGSRNSPHLVTLAKAQSMMRKPNPTLGRSRWAPTEVQQVQDIGDT